MFDLFRCGAPPSDSMDKLVFPNPAATLLAFPPSDLACLSSRITRHWPRWLGRACTSLGAQFHPGTVLPTIPLHGGCHSLVIFLLIPIGRNNRLKFSWPDPLFLTDAEKGGCFSLDFSPRFGRAASKVVRSSG
jgi:hypothetical protein